jgi:ubiquinone/menaquinone biosynthesis C-methylase UbiE
MARSRIATLAKHFPEVGIAGFTAIDGTVGFFTQVNTLLRPDMTVLDYGAGRAEWYEDDDCEYRRKLRTIRSKVARVIGCDVDPAVLENKSVDEAFVLRQAQALPLADSSIDLIVCDYTFEHIDDPVLLAAEFSRVLKPGGMICGRTPNKYAYISLATRAVPNGLHTRLLRRAQPARKTVDVFPTRFKLNSFADIERYFPKRDYENFTYRGLPEPGYHFNSSLALSTMLILDKCLPKVLTAGLYIFLRKRLHPERQPTAAAASASGGLQAVDVTCA